MLPPSGAADGVLIADDTLDIPVLLRRGPLAPVRRLRPAAMDAVAAPWPGQPMSPGRYLVRTTWRDVLDAACAVPILRSGR
jgi:hypothetical protein